MLAVIFLPVCIYHVTYHAMWTARNLASRQFVSPFIPMHDWYRDRIYRLDIGYYLKVDAVSESTVFGIFAVGFILLATALAFRPRQTALVKKMVLTNLLFLLVAAELNEDFFPVPSGSWLAYDRRFSLIVYVVCLTVAATPGLPLPLRKPDGHFGSLLAPIADLNSELIALM